MFTFLLNHFTNTKSSTVMIMLNISTSMVINANMTKITAEFNVI